MLIIGHRGACGYEAENSLASFQRALDLGVNMVELDLYVCKTGEMVVTHDNNVKLTTNGYGNVVDMSFQELRALKVQGKEQIPTLQEVIALINRRIPINIELKRPNSAKPVAQLINKYLKNGWSNDDFVVSWFDHDQGNEFKQLCPTIKTGILFSSQKTKNIIQRAAQHQANFIGLDVKAVTKELVHEVHVAGFEVYVWTINDKVVADRMRSFKVDGIFSDYPDRV